VFYVVGLALTAAYLVFEDALVGWICVVIETAFAIIMLAAKIYLDYWGPYSMRGEKRDSSQNLGISSRARLELHRFLGGHGGARFPLLLRVDEKHAAAHLLLDCRITEAKHGTELSFSRKKEGNVVHSSDTTAVDIPAATLEAGLPSLPSTSPTSVPNLNELADLLEESLENCGIDVQRRQTLSFPSFRRSMKVDGHAGFPNSLQPPQPSMCFIPCKDGYVTVMWFSATMTLSVDYVGAAPETISNMNSAASEFCRSLTQAYPGTAIVASSIGRVPII